MDERNPYTDKYVIWCSCTGMYLHRGMAENGYTRVYDWTDDFYNGMRFPETEMMLMSDVLDGTFVKGKNTFVFEVVGAAILETGEPLSSFYLIPIERGFGEVERLV